MDLNIVTLPKEEALERYRLYQAAVRRSRHAADRLMMRAYKSLSEGQGVINLIEVLKAGGVHQETWLPKLAVMRADQPHVYFRRRNNGAGFYSFSERYYITSKTRKGQALRLQFSIPENGQPFCSNYSERPGDYWDTHSAPVPPIPPEYRPADALSKYCILWEVPVWSPVRPPDDPVLLRALGGDLYAVLAHWDLTEIEKMVLASILGS